MRRTVTLALLLTGALLGAAAADIAAQDLVGIVVDDTGMTALPGVKVTIVAQQRATFTDADGYFTFQGVPSGKLSVRLEKAGYVSMSEDVAVGPGGLTLVRFEVPAVAAFLDQLTVVGRRKAPTGDLAGTVVRGGDNKGPARTALDLLAYRVPGLLVIRGDGTQGHDIRLLIRGVSSLSLSNEPVVYVDGVRTRSLDQLQDIAASDVEMIRVLPGASAATLYPDGANGVILIKTREGPGTGKEP